VTGQGSAAQRVAGRVKEAVEAADLDALASLLDPRVRWGPPGDPVPPCRDREQVLTWYRRARDAGARARVTETVVRGDKFLVGLKVTGGRGARPGEEADRWQGFTVADGRITAITGFGDRNEGTVWAGLAPAPPPRPGAIRWSAPGHRLADDPVGLRLPELADAAVLHGYATRPGGLEGSWVPLPADASLPDCQALVRDWMAGWAGQRSFHGPALVITAAGNPALAGLVGLDDRGGRVVELSYGVAPDRRGRGYATRAARLTARWLLHDGHASMIELRIGSANTASQRVAAAAGFTLARETGSPAPATSKTGDDLCFVMRQHQR